MTDNDYPQENGFSPGTDEDIPVIPEEPAAEVFEPVPQEAESVKKVEPPVYKSSRSRGKTFRPKKPPEPLRFVFGDMWGVVFFIWLPVVVGFFLPWHQLVPDAAIIGNLKYHQAIFGLVLALPPWIVLIIHLSRGRLLDGILDMFLLSLIHI